MGITSDIEMALANVSERLRRLEVDHTPSPDVRRLAERVAKLEGALTPIAPKHDTPVYPNLPEPLRTLAIEAHGALHTVWTKNAHQVGYVKAEWQALAEAISKLVRAATP